MGEVVEIASRRPHMSGPAKCLHCDHEWISVSPQEEYRCLECPKCGLDKGIYAGLVGHAEGDLIYRCNCGCDIFEVGTYGIQCVVCGHRVGFEQLMDMRPGPRPVG